MLIYIFIIFYRFAKNLDPNSLSLKFFKGEGELTNLELEEGLISELLELPPWLQLSKVTCNRISAKVGYYQTIIIVELFLFFFSERLFIAIIIYFPLYVLLLF